MAKAAAPKKRAAPADSQQQKEKLKKVAKSNTPGTKASSAEKPANTDEKKSSKVGEKVTGAKLIGMTSEQVEQLKNKTKQVEQKELKKEKSKKADSNDVEDSSVPAPDTPTSPDSHSDAIPTEKVKVTRKSNSTTVKSGKTKNKTFIPLSSSESGGGGGSAKTKTSRGSTPKKANRKTSKKINKRNRFRAERGVVYLSHIPHGFYEKQMRNFFSQFGAITNLRLGRSKKTGRSMGYAFIEFQYAEVAKIIAETMNNYLMFNRIMKCQLLDKEKCSRAIFMNKINPDKPPGVVARRRSKALHNMNKTKETEKKHGHRLTKKAAKVGKAMAEKGIDFKIEIS